MPALFKNALVYHLIFLNKIFPNQTTYAIPPRTIFGEPILPMRKMFSCLSVALCALPMLLGLSACYPDKQHQHVETRSMVEILDSLYRHEQFPRSFARNDIAVKALSQQVQQYNATNDMAGFLMLKMRLAEQMLLDNQVNGAIQIYNSVLSEIEKQNFDDNEKRYLRNAAFAGLGLAYLRMGELQNCVVNHNAKSCLLPLAPQALHIDKTAGATSLKYLLNEVKNDPTNQRIVWLANIAAAVIGQHPQALPADVALDFDKYSAGNDFAEFKNVAAEKGVDRFGHYGGVDVEDFNNDGLPDIFATSGNLNENVHLYLQQPNGTFIDNTAASGLTGITGGASTIHADYDNDGLVDIYIMRGGWLGKGGMLPNSLLKNLGNGRFEDVTIKAGLLAYKITHTACWADFNNDGWLDLFVGHENNYFDMSGPFPHSESELFMNNRDGTFTEVGKESGLNFSAWVKGVVSLDYDRDGLMDIFVSNYTEQNMLYRNTGPDKKGICHFTNVAASAGVANPVFSFPVAACDINQDGWDDIFINGFDIDGVALPLEYQGKENARSPLHVFINQKNGTFKDEGGKYGIANRSIYAMSVNYADLDLDGYPDIYLGTGFSDLAALYPNVLLHNINGQKFVDVTKASGTGHLQKGHAIALCDIDQDGDNDIYAEFGGFFTGDAYWNAYFQNPGNGNQWVSLKLQGVKANRSAIGGQIKVIVTDGNTQRAIYTRISTGASYGCSSLQQLVGLGKANNIESIEVTWPGETKAVVYHHFATRKAYLIKQDNPDPKEIPYRSTNTSSEVKTAGAHKM